MKTGIFGGSFNPPHKGHKKALDAFISTLNLDKVYVIPSFVSPHKTSPELSASFEDRLHMCRLAFSECEGEIIFSDIERKLFDLTGKKSYTVNTLEQMEEENICLFVGSDMFFTLDSWERADYIFKNVTVAVMSREDDGDKVRHYKEKYEKDYSAKIEIVSSPHIEISSTEIRKGYKAIETAVPSKVSEYIKERNLYKKKRTREELVALVKERLPEKRFLHTLKVEEEAMWLTSHLCPDFKEDISRAALLHDVTKPLPLKEHLKIKKDLSEEDLKSPETLHALTGAEYARSIFENENVCSMIEKHTTAHPEMTLFEMIVFVSDYTEETRSHAACREERERLHRELVSASSREEKYFVILDSVIRILENTVRYLTDKKSYIHSRTTDALVALRGKK